jgi:hypothetical protein
MNEDEREIQSLCSQIGELKELAQAADLIFREIPGDRGDYKVAAIIATLLLKLSDGLAGVEHRVYRLRSVRIHRRPVRRNWSRTIANGRAAR